MRRRRRTALLIAAAAFLALLLVVGVSHVTPRGDKLVERRGHRRKKLGAVRFPAALRSSQALLPVRAPELETLKELPLERWSDHQRRLLNMTYRPWLQRAPQSVCAEIRTGFTSGAAPTALVSLPSSGNTWLRFLIEGATGVFTGSVYSDVVLIRSGMYGEVVPADSGTTLVQKTHGYTTLEGVGASRQRQRRHFSHVRRFGCRGLLLIRSPLAAIVSHRHLDTGGHLGFAPHAKFVGEDWASFVAQKATFWRTLYTDWIEQCPPEQLLVVYFEHLLDDLPAQMTRILTFLGVEADPVRLQCLYSYPDGSLRRRRMNRSPDLVVSHPYTDHQRTMVMEQVQQLDQLLLERGFGPLPKYT